MKVANMHRKTGFWQKAVEIFEEIERNSKDLDPYLKFKLERDMAKAYFYDKDSQKCTILFEKVSKYAKNLANSNSTLSGKEPTSSSYAGKPAMNQKDQLHYPNLLVSWGIMMK